MLNQLDLKYNEIVSLSNFFSGSLKFMIGLIRLFFIYKHAYQNYLEIIFKIIKRHPEITCVLCNGNSFVLTSFQLINFLAVASNRPEIQLDFKQDLVKLKMFDENTSKICDIVIHGGISNGDINGIFINKDYGDSPIKDRTVLDLGANIADSAIYFSLKGATKVIGVEPFSRNFNLAVKNVKENNLEKKIILEQAICSDFSGTTEIDLNTFSTASSVFEPKTGLKIHSFTIEELISKYNLPSTSILKVDCEGDEYKILLSSSKDTLRTFDFILLEYHYGYQNLKNKLESCGFNVKVESPIVTGQINWFTQFIKNIGHSKTKTKIGATGLLFAKRNSI
jgi:FkbM family methyltransferase